MAEVHSPTNLHESASTSTIAPLDLKGMTKRERHHGEPVLEESQKETLKDFASRAVDEIVVNIVDAIKDGDLKLNYSKAPGWNYSPTNKDSVEKIRVRRKFDRVTKLLQLESSPAADPERELLKLNERLLRDNLSTTTPPTEVVAEDLKLMQQAKEYRQRVKEVQKEEAERRRRLRELEDRRMDALRKELARQDEERHKMEEEIFQQREQKEEACRQRMAMREEERKKEKELMKVAQHMVTKRKKEMPPVPLHERLKEQFEQNFILPEIERRKQVLEQVKNGRRPLNFDEIRQHEQKVVELVTQQQHQLRQIRGSTHAELPLSDYFRGKASQRVLAEQQARIEALHAREEEARLKRDKLKSYAVTVREQHAPKVDERKRQELQAQLDSKVSAKARALDDVARRAKFRDANAFIRQSHRTIGAGGGGGSGLSSGTESPTAAVDSGAEDGEHYQEDHKQQKKKKKKRVSSEGAGVSTPREGSRTIQGSEGKQGAAAGGSSPAPVAAGQTLTGADRPRPGAPPRMPRRAEKKESDPRVLADRARELDQAARHAEQTLHDVPEVGVSVDDSARVDNMYINAIKTKLQLLSQHPQS